MTDYAGTAGAGSLILEFGTLSRLTGDDRFEKAAYKAFFALWNHRSDIGLVGNTVNIYTGVSGHYPMTAHGILIRDCLRPGHIPKSIALVQELTRFMNTP